MIYQQDGNNDFAAVSKNGKQIIVSRDGIEKSLDNNLYLIDAETRKETLLTAHTDASQFGDVEFLPDGDSIVLATNKDREYSSMAQIDNLREGGAKPNRHRQKRAGLGRRINQSFTERRRARLHRQPRRFFGIKLAKNRG